MQDARRRLRFGILAAALLALAATGARAGQAPAGRPGAEASRHPGAATASRPNALRATVRPGDTLDLICARLRERAGYYSDDDMLAAVRRANNLQTNLVRPGRELIVPLAAVALPAPVARRVADGAAVRGLYLAGPACGVSTVLDRVDRFIAAGGNTVVFDAKDVDGAVSYRSADALAGWGRGRAAPVIPSLPAMVDRFHARGLHVVARLAVFLDGELGVKRPDLAALGPGGARLAALGAAWLDPSRPEVRAYNLALAVELAQAGVDEVQLDYVRYPAGLRAGRATGEATRDVAACAARRCAVIGDFVAQVRDSLHARGATLSVVIGGTAGWGDAGVPALDGQDPVRLAAAADVLCPAIFPGQFAPGFAGCARPAGEPGRICFEGVRGLRARVSDTTPIRPWLQAFAWNTPEFDGGYVAAQVRGAQEAGADGWCLWNPASQYQVALPELPALALPLAVVGAMGAPRR